MSRILAIIGLICVFEAAVFAINNPVGPTTTPQSSLGGGGSNGLTPNPNGQNINSGNDIVSGNVGGGKEFRGFVPYGSQYYFQGNQGDASVQNFIRRSSGNPYGTTAQRSQTYISPYQAVTTLRGGRPLNSQVYTPQGSISRTTGVNEYGLVPLEEARKLMTPEKQESQLSLDTIAPLQYGRFRPLTVSPEEKEPFITQEVEAKLYPTELRERQQQQSRELKEQLEKLKTGEEPITPQPTKPTDQVEDLVAKPTNPGQEPKPQPQRVAGVFEEMRELARKETDKSLAKIAADRAKKQQESQQPGAQEQPTTEEQPTFGSGFGEISPEMAKAIVGYSKTFAVQSRDRFNELMQAGEEYLKSKKFYKAADAYTLAAIYQKDNPLPVAGKSHALFAAGEYMSSAYYLSRAIEIWPDYLRFRVDLYSFFDKDLVENRIAEITSWQEKTNSPELLMLLGYIYYQTDRLELAQMSVNGAKVKMPESQSLQMLDAVIRGAIAQQPQAK